MVKQTKNPGFDPRDLWLAGLGVVSLTRKQATRAYGALVQEGGQFRDAAAKRIDALNKQARANLGEVKAKVEAGIDPLLSRATEAYGVVKGEIQARLSPVVSRASKTAKPARKAATRKVAAASKTVKKTATKARRAVKKAA